MLQHVSSTNGRKRASSRRSPPKIKRSTRQRNKVAGSGATQYDLFASCIPFALSNCIDVHFVIIVIADQFRKCKRKTPESARLNSVAIEELTHRLMRNFVLVRRYFL